MDHGADNVSLDLMSRLLMDIQNDSSRIIDSLVSEYQRSILDTIFYGDRETSTCSCTFVLRKLYCVLRKHRWIFAGDKFNIIMAEMINPKIKADLYLDRGENESELKQVRTNVISPVSLDDLDFKCAVVNFGFSFNNESLLFEGVGRYVFIPQYI